MEDYPHQPPAAPPTGSPLPYQQPIYYQPSTPEKKNRVGIVIGVIAAAVLIVSALAVGGLIISKVITTPKTPASVSTFASSPINPSTPVNPSNPAFPDLPDNLHADPYVDDQGRYVNNQIGISLIIPDTWNVEESSKLPDEVLGINYLNDDAIYVWIDRFPALSVEAFLADKEQMMSSYTFGSGKAEVIMTTELEVELAGQNWHSYVFATINGDDNLVVNLFVTDMPNHCGLLMYAMIVEAVSPDSIDANGLKEGLAILYSLKFIDPGGSQAY
ncbi:MAG: hypothetical protein LBU61_04060 [Coriobacteriales bacterium]|jgi:hypothetical protein|nr:hypothetical protein [Coriobacteriales bacterium]